MKEISMTEIRKEKVKKGIRIKQLIKKRESKDKKQEKTRQRRRRKKDIQ